VDVPPALAHEFRRESEWLAALPRLAAECAEEWDLDLEGPVDTPHSLVVPAGDVVLKINAPSHFEAEHEAADALLCWQGAGAVQVLARDDSRRAFLMERCRPGTRLWDTDANEVDVVVKLLPRLWIEPEDPHRFRRIADEAERWAGEVQRHYERGGRPFERRLLDLAFGVFENAGQADGSIANQDLHGWNILSAEREPWLVIDPKPVLAERELNGVGLLRNAVFRGGRACVRRWLDVLEGLGLDRARLRGWGVAHALAWGWDDETGWSSAMVDAADLIQGA